MIKGQRSAPSHSDRCTSPKSAIGIQQMYKSTQRQTAPSPPAPPQEQQQLKATQAEREPHITDTGRKSMPDASCCWWRIWERGGGAAGLHSVRPTPEFGEGKGRGSHDFCSSKYPVCVCVCVCACVYVCISVCVCMLSVFEWLKIFHCTCSDSMSACQREGRHWRRHGETGGVSEWLLYLIGHGSLLAHIGVPLLSTANTSKKSRKNYFSRRYLHV